MQNDNDDYGELMMLEKSNAKFALLTPVPFEHLISGIKKCAESGKVTYGSNAIKRLMSFNDLYEKGFAIDILFYASRNNGSSEPEVTYKARFEKYVAATDDGLSPIRYIGFRPESTVNDKPWNSFYIISQLEKLKSHIPVKKLTGRNKSDTYSSKFYPRGPMIIKSPNGT